MLVKKLEKFKEGRATETDFTQLKHWCDMLHSMCRFGLGIAAPNSTLSTLKSFPEIYRSRLASEETYPGFKQEEALQEASCILNTEEKRHAK